MKERNASTSKLIASTKVQTGLKAEHLALNDVLTKNEMSQDMEEQDNKFGMSRKESIIGNQLFMSTSCSNVHGKVCVRHQANEIVCNSLVTKGKETRAIISYTHPMWMKFLSKDYVFLKEVLTSYYDKLR